MSKKEINTEGKYFRERENKSQKEDGMRGKREGMGSKRRNGMSRESERVMWLRDQ